MLFQKHVVCYKSKSTFLFCHINVINVIPETRGVLYIYIYVFFYINVIPDKCYFRPTLEYASNVWDPTGQNKINVQRRAARCVTKDSTSRTPGCITYMVNSLG